MTTKFFPDAMNYQFQTIDIDNMSDSDKFGLEFGKKIQTYLFDYQNVFYVLMIPFLALISKLIFIDKKDFNLSEHFVMNIYGYSQMSILINLVYISIIWNNKLVYYAATFNGIFQIVYFAYIFKKIFKLSAQQIILRTLLFLIVLGFVFVAIIVLIAIYLIIFTDTFQQMAPK